MCHTRVDSLIGEATVTKEGRAYRIVNCRNKSTSEKIYNIGNHILASIYIFFMKHQISGLIQSHCNSGDDSEYSFI